MLLEVREGCESLQRSGRPSQKSEKPLLKVWEGSGVALGGPEGIGCLFRRFGRGRESLPEVRKALPKV